MYSKVGWEQRFREVYIASMELFLMLNFSVEEIKERTWIKGEATLSSSYFYRRAATHMYESTCSRNQLHDSILIRLNSWRHYFGISPFEVCRILSYKSDDLLPQEISALFWSLLCRGVQCPIKLYQYVYRKIDYLIRSQYYAENKVLSACISAM